MASARDGIDVLLRDRGLRKTTPDVAAESLLRGAWASAVLAGTTSDEDAVRAGRGDAVAQASLRLSTHVLGLTGVLARSPLQVLARLHAVAAADEPSDTVGRPRDADSARRLADVAALLSRPTTAPGLVVAAVVHAEILSARRSPPTTVSWRAPPSGSSSSSGASTGLGATVPEAGHLAAARRTRPASRRTPRRRSRATRVADSQPHTPGCCTPRRPTPPARTTARCCAESRMRACVSGVPAGPDKRAAPPRGGRRRWHTGSGLPSVHAMCRLGMNPAVDALKEGSVSAWVPVRVRVLSCLPPLYVARFRATSPGRKSVDDAPQQDVICPHRG